MPSADHVSPIGTVVLALSATTTYVKLWWVRDNTALNPMIVCRRCARDARSTGSRCLSARSRSSVTLTRGSPGSAVRRRGNLVPCQELVCPTRLAATHAIRSQTSATREHVVCAARGHLGPGMAWFGSSTPRKRGGIEGSTPRRLRLTDQRWMRMSDPSNG